jgi:glyoxylase-like metal-dependent hydrolase (beta-lactamase superfamily II)
LELEPGIHQLAHGRKPFGIPSPNVYLIQGTDASMFVDSGWDNEDDHTARMTYLKSVGGPPLTEILITHRHGDHGGGALRIHNDIGTPTSAHRLDQAAIEVERFGGAATLDRVLEGGESYDLGGLTLQVVHAPGHTVGSLAVIIPERNVMLSADSVLGVTTTVVRPSEGDLGKYVQTLAMLRDLRPGTIYPGHGGPLTDPGGRIQQLIDHRLHREDQLLAELATAPQTIDHLFLTIYPTLPEERHRIAKEQIESQLIKLTNEGRVAADGEVYLLT